MTGAESKQQSVPAIRLGVVEDDDLTRESLVTMLEESSGFRCVAAAKSAEDALRHFPVIRPDVVLMDINLPGRSGVDCTRELKRKLPGTHFMMLTVYEDADRIFQSLQAGATGYLLKRTPPDELLDSIRDLHAGGSPMSSVIARKVVVSFSGAASPVEDILTPREREIIGELARGYAYKEIADRLQIGVTTVRSHLQNIYGKLHVQNRTEAVVKFLKK